MFTPTRRQSEAKAKFWATVRNNPMIGDPTLLSQKKVEQFSSVKCMDHWFPVEGFKEWFFDSNYNHTILQGAVEVAISEAIAMISMPVDGEKGSPRYADKMAAIKLILEYAGFSPVAKKPKEDNPVEDMDEQQLDRLIHESMEKQKLTAN